MNIEYILSALFISLCCFVAINLVLSLILWKYSKNEVYKRIVKYWAATIVFFAFQFFFPHTPLQIALAYGVGILPMIYVYSLVYKLFGIQTNIVKFAVIHIAAIISTLTFWKLGFGFTAMALPISISISIPLLYSIKTIFFTHHSQASLLQRLLGGLLIFWIPHCFTFAFFRMIDGAQFYGWITSYTLYDMMAILLPAIAVEETFRTEKARLEQQVRSRTIDLRRALGDKENLLKILVHDISNPLTVMRWYLTDLKKRPTQDPLKYIEKIIKSQEIVENIVKKVRVLQTEPKSQSVTPISFNKCLEELHFVFEKALLAKNLTLEVCDHTKGNDIIMADQFSLTHNVLSNFINNSIKFSFPDSVIKIIVTSTDDQLQVEIQDSGVGMNKETISRIYDNQNLQSSQGTQGESGSGIGLSIAKTMLSNFGACLEIESEEYHEASTNHGTKIILKFPLIENSSVTSRD